MDEQLINRVRVVHRVFALNQILVDFDIISNLFVARSHNDFFVSIWINSSASMVFIMRNELFHTGETRTAHGRAGLDKKH